MATPIDAILSAKASVEKTAGEVADTLVMHPTRLDTIKRLYARELHYNAERDGLSLVGMVVRTNSLAKGIAFFKGDKLLKVIE